MTENEILRKKPVKKSIAMGSYTMDSHNTQRYITRDGYVQNEGDIGVHPPKPYKIELGAILPQKEKCTNLAVPVAVSSSHIAFVSIRMEPVFMALTYNLLLNLMQHFIASGQLPADLFKLNFLKCPLCSRRFAWC